MTCNFYTNRCATGLRLTSFFRRHPRHEPTNPCIDLQFIVYWLTSVIACRDVTQEHGQVVPVMSFDVRDIARSKRVIYAIELTPSFIFLETATGRLTRMLASSTTEDTSSRGRDENRTWGRCDSSWFTTIDIISRKLMMNVIILSGDSRETRWHEKHSLELWDKWNNLILSEKIDNFTFR